MRIKRSFLIYILPLIIIAAFALSGCGGGVDAEAMPGESPESTPQTRDVLTRKNHQPAKWTYLVYIAADNDLEPTAWQDISKMEQIGSNDSVNIVFQWDNRGEYGNRGCRRYYITKNPETSPGKVSSPVIKNLGDINSADPDELVDFVKWGMKNYPAEKYAIVLWNHGAGWRWPSASENHPRARGICFDQTSNDFMTESELRGAFREIYFIRGDKIDFIGIDACLMGMTEIAYSLKDYGNYITFSESSVYGWPYHYILGDLTTAPEFDGKRLCKSTVERFRQYWIEEGIEYFTTISAVDLGQVDSLTLSVNEFSILAIDVMDEERDKIRRSIQETESVDDIFTDFRDLNLFMQRIEKNVVNPDLKASAVRVSEAITRAVIHEAHGERFSTETAGLTIWMPNEGIHNEFISEYSVLPFSQITMWDEFLEELK